MENSKFGHSLIRKPQVLILGFYTLILLVWAFILHVLPDKNTLANYFYNGAYALVYLYGGFLAVLGSVRLGRDSNLGKAVFFVGLGLFSWGVGGLIWFYGNVITKIEVPYPSIADVFFFSYIPFYTLGIIYILSIYKEFIAKKVLFEVGIIASLFIVTIFAIVQPDATQYLPLITRFLNLAYPIGDVVILTLAYITLRLSGGRVKLYLLFLALAIIIQAIADIAFTYRTAHGLYWNGDIADILYVASGVINVFAIIIIVASFIEEKETSTDDSKLASHS